MTTRKNRIPIPQGMSDAAMVASDSTCCVCHMANRPVQIHHIDENPANNDIGNLAVLCLDCHHKTQIHGGFAKTLTSGLVRQHRDEWLGLVEEKKRVLAGHPAAAVPARPPRRTMTSKQAQRHAERLRSLYVTYYRGILGVENFAVAMSEPWGGETLELRTQRLKTLLDEAMNLIDSTLPGISVEPGSQTVCTRNGFFFSLFEQYLDALKTSYEYGCERFQSPDKSGYVHKLNLKIGRHQMSRQVESIRSAIQAHIKSVDNLS